MAGTIYALLRFSRQEYLQRFRDEGFLYLNTLQYFRDLESDPERADPFEGTETIIQPKDLGESFIDTPTHLGRIAISPQDLAGPVRIALNRTMACNVYCTFGVTGPVDSDIVPERGLGLGDWFVLVLNPSEFISRVSAAARDVGLGCQSGLVQYYDSRQYSGYVGPFRKPSEFASQNEFRLVLGPGCGQPVELVAGSLVDITSEVLPTCDVNTLLDFSSSSFCEAGLANSSRD
jgi:hypothetical protein